MEPSKKTALERQIAATDTQLDTLIYAPYGLEREEVGVIETSNGSFRGERAARYCG